MTAAVEIEPEQVPPRTSPYAWEIFKLVADMAQLGPVELAAAHRRLARAVATRSRSVRAAHLAAIAAARAAYLPGRRLDLVLTVLGTQAAAGHCLATDGAATPPRPPGDPRTTGPTAPAPPATPPRRHPRELQP
jgi:hypothetical protein